MRRYAILISLIILFVACLIFANAVVNNATKKGNDNIETNSADNIMTVNPVVSISSKNFTKEVLSSDRKVLVDFYAEWCEPCKMVSPLVEEVADENPDVKFVKVNVDDNEDLSTTHRIVYIPTFVVFENGKETKRSVGYVEKNEIEELIK